MSMEEMTYKDGSLLYETPRLDELALTNGMIQAGDGTLTFRDEDNEELISRYVDDDGDEGLH